MANGTRKSYSLSDVAVVVPTLDPNPNLAHQSAESAPAVVIETARVTVRVGEKRNGSDHILGHGHHLPLPVHDQHRGPALPHLRQSSVIKKRSKVVKVARPVLTNLFYSSATNQNLLSEGVLATKGVLSRHCSDMKTFNPQCLYVA